jgi:hypothetical protein
MLVTHLVFPLQYCFFVVRIALTNPLVRLKELAGVLNPGH